MTPTIETTMTAAYWCVLIAIIMPILFAGLAKFTSGFRPKDNHNPRAYLATLSGWQQRANWAQQNTFESIPGFMAAVVIAHQMGGNQDNIDMLAITTSCFASFMARFISPILHCFERLHGL